MEIIDKKTYLIISCKKLQDFHHLIHFLQNDIDKQMSLIINLLNSNINETIIIEALLPFSLNWEKQNKSFILVSNIRRESLRGMVSIKSLEEAIDFFHMEDLTRSI